MLQFFKYVLATIIGLFLFVVISFFMMIGIGSMLSSSDSVTTVKEKSVLKLNFDSRFTELTIPEDPFSEMFSDGDAEHRAERLQKCHCQCRPGSQYQRHQYYRQ
ncbi:MAG: hypothetical protein LRY55_10960 [Leadbetterella sp.]|nr:hypothetical protein [Leadbetterella sp.]